MSTGIRMVAILDGDDSTYVCWVPVNFAGPGSWGTPADKVVEAIEQAAKMMSRSILREAANIDSKLLPIQEAEQDRYAEMFRRAYEVDK